MFVLLEHRVPQSAPARTSPPVGLHWDFLVALAGQEALATWRLAANPLEGGAGIPAERLPDHRRLYLEFEGPLSCNRGSVRRIDCGACAVEDVGVGLRAQVRGGVLHGLVEIRPDASGRLIFHYQPVVSGGRRA